MSIDLPIANGKPRYYIGLMSGTSADGIDLALVNFFDDNQPKLIASYYQAYTDKTALKITSLYNPANNEIDRAFELDIELAQQFSGAIDALLQQEQLCCNDIIAIGSHGQTIRHRPTVKYPFTLQIGCCQTLATLTNIRVIGQFRRKDMALGGQGAPLVPAFHEKIFTDSHKDVFVVNIGGIANISFLPAGSASSELSLLGFPPSDKSKQVLGFDTGPGNALMDDWFSLHNSTSKTKYDKGGAWAASGQVNTALLKQLLSDEYFQLAAPKSTGREYFNLPWLTEQLTLFNSRPNELQTNASQEKNSLSHADVQATLTQFTAFTISAAITKLSKSAKVYICGGGAHNKTLKSSLSQQLNKQLNQQSKEYPSDYELLLTSQKGIDGDQLEAIAFAWLAFAYDTNLLSSMPAVTGASKGCTLGTCFSP